MVQDQLKFFHGIFFSLRNFPRGCATHGAGPPAAAMRPEPGACRGTKTPVNQAEEWAQKPEAAAPEPHGSSLRQTSGGGRPNRGRRPALLAWTQAERSADPRERGEAAESEPPMGSPLDRARAESSSAPRAPLDLCPDEAYLWKKVKSPQEDLQAIRDTIRVLKEQVKLTAEGDVPKPGSAVPGQRLRGCLH